jgi:large subunit ribosomal protein L4
MELPVLDMQGEAVGTLEVSEFLFATPMNVPVVHQAMLRQRANARQGTSNTKTRAHVSGGGAKPRMQKHSGRSRQGSIRAPHFRGGGIVFGPHPRSYRQRLPKKMRRLALRCLLSDKVREDQIAILHEFRFPEVKTKEMSRLLNNLKVSSSALIVTPGVEPEVIRSAHNLPDVKTLPATNLNVLDLLNHDKVIMTVAGIRKAEELWAHDGPGTEMKATAKGEVNPKPTLRKRRASETTTKTRTTRKTSAKVENPNTEPSIGESKE